MSSQPAWVMGRNGLFMSEADQFYPASASSRMQHPSGGGMPHDKAHRPMTVIKKPGMADANVIK